MALANIFAKVVELEKKIQEITGSSEQPIVSEPTVSSADLVIINNRLNALENVQVSCNIDELMQRFIALEEKQLDNKLSVLQSQVSALQGLEQKFETFQAQFTSMQNKLSQLEGSFLDKLTNIENNVLVDLKSRVAILEQKLSSQTE